MGKQQSFSLMVCLLMVIGLLVGCQSAPPAATATPVATPEVAEDDELRIGLVTGTGGIDDGGFNQLAYAGLVNVSRRTGIAFEYQRTDRETRDYEAAISNFLNGEFDIVVTVGFNMREATLAAAAEHPEIHFIGIDQSQPETLPNVTGVIFKDDQAGYLAGVLAGNLTETNKVAGIYGSQLIEPVVAFSVGFESGVQSVNPDAEVITTFHPEDSPAVAFNDPEWGAEITAEYIEDGVDVFFAAGGDTGNGVLVETANVVKNNEGAQLYCIGVDTDQWQTISEARPCLVSSALKQIPQAIDEVIAQIIDGDPPAGNYFGPIGLAPFHDFEDDISDELKSTLEQTAEDLINGSIVTGYESNSG